VKVHRVIVCVHGQLCCNSSTKKCKQMGLVGDDEMTGENEENTKTCAV